MDDKLDSFRSRPRIGARSIFQHESEPQPNEIMFTSDKDSASMTEQRYDMSPIVEQPFVDSPPYFSERESSREIVEMSTP
jgi:hypothetical protein